MRKARIVSTLAASLALVLLIAGVAQSVVQIELVVGGKGEQYRGFANDSYVVYTSRLPRTRVSSALARSVADGVETTLNADGTNGNVGGIDPTTNVVLYQQWTRGRSGLFLYDLDTGERRQAAGVNSRFWEWNPLMSSTFIVYALDRVRDGVVYTSLKVFHREDLVTRTLGTWRWDRTRMFPGSAGGSYLTYTTCTKSNCSAYLYNWDTGAKQRIPTVNGRAQYAPVIDEVNSTVHFTRSGDRCGQSVGIWRLPVPLADGDEPTQVVDLPRGIDTGWESSLTADSETGQMDLYFERWNCANKTGDVYVAGGVDREQTT
jgi:Tol biopolymer transport system component